MTNNRQIPRLDDMAFEALLRHRMEITPNSETEYEVLKQQMIKKITPMFTPFLQLIADGNQDEVKKFLNDYPQLAEFAYGTVTTLSGDTFKNVTAIQLAYLVEDEKIGKVLIDALDDPDSRENIKQQLDKKIAEVEEQQAHFSKYNFTALENAITKDQSLRKNRDKASLETEKAFAECNEYFKPRIATKGRPFNIKDLQGAYELYSKKDWNSEQIVWFLQNVIRLLLGRVSACYGQAISSGLLNHFTRSLNPKDEHGYDYRDHDYFSYYACCHSPVLNRFLFDIRRGWAGQGMIYIVAAGALYAEMIESHANQKQQGWKDLRRRLQQPQDQFVLGHKA